MRLGWTLLRAIAIVLFALLLARGAAAEATAYGNCAEHIAAIIAEREAQKKLSLDQRNRRFERLDEAFQRRVTEDLDRQHKSWLAESQSFLDEMAALSDLPTDQKAPEIARLNEELSAARQRNLRAQQEILDDSRSWRFEQIGAAQEAYTAAVARHNTTAQEKIDRIRSTECVTRQP